jgi:hypothetical protein
MVVPFLLLAACANVVSAFDSEAALAWADKNCAGGVGECSEFASNALKAGGETVCWDKWAPNFVRCLVWNYNPHHYYQTSFPGPKGSVIVYYDHKCTKGDGNDVYMPGFGVTCPFHVAISRGDGTQDQHNPARCGSAGNWATNYVMAAYGSIDANGTAVLRPPNTTHTNLTRSGLPCAPDHEVCHDGLCCPRSKQK